MSFCTEQESTYKNIAVIGLGAAGGFASVLLSKNSHINITAFDTKEPFSTLLPTGGGRCNISYDEDNIKEFAKNYPRGEKFLLSVFSKCNNKKTIEIFKDMGIKTYVQADKRIFPVSNSSEKTVKTLQNMLERKNFTHIKEKVTEIIKKEEKFIINTNKNTYEADAVILATGGKGNGFELAKNSGHTIKDLRPSLCAFEIKEKYLYELSGLTFKNVKAIPVINNKKKEPYYGDIMFSHKSVTGPLIFKMSAITAYNDFSEENPFELILTLTDKTNDEINEIIKNNPKKNIKNVFTSYAPESYIIAVCGEYGIDCLKQTAQIKKTEKEILINSIINMKLHVTGRIKNSEIVTAGGVCTDEINPKTMESKLVKGLFFTGEIIDVDGFTGGFNLQNCWSDAYICACALLNKNV